MGLRGAWVHRARSTSFALASGVLHALACPPFGLWPISFVALVPLVLAIHRQSMVAALGLGWLGGFATVALGYYWLPQVLNDFSALGSAGAWVMALVIDGYQAGRWALLAGVYAFCARRWSPGLSLLVAHGSAELLYPLPFPWFLGVAVHDVPAFTQVADLAGPMTVSFLLVATNALVCEIILPRPDRSRSTRSRWLFRAVLALIPLAGVFYGVARQARIATELEGAPAVRVGIVQAALDTSQSGDRRGSIERGLSLSKELLAASPVDLLIWSEGAVRRPVRLGFAERDLETSVTRLLRVPTLFGASLSHQSSQGEATAINTAFLGDRMGRICKTCRYDKQLLLPVGEYLPGEGWFSWLREYFPRAGRFRPGPRAAPILFQGRPIGVAICYEDIHPDYVNAFNQERPIELLVNITNDAWFQGTSAAEWHFVLAKFRAIEQRRFLVRATNTGVSGIVDPTGRVTLTLPEAEPGAAAGQVRFLQEETWFQRVGQWPWWIALVGLLLGAARPTVGPRRRVDLSSS